MKKDELAVSLNTDGAKVARIPISAHLLPRSQSMSADSQRQNWLLVKQIHQCQLKRNVHHDQWSSKYFLSKYYQSMTLIPNLPTTLCPSLSTKLRKSGLIFNPRPIYSLGLPSTLTVFIPAKQCLLLSPSPTQRLNNSSADLNLLTWHYSVMANQRVSTHPATCYNQNCECLAEVWCFPWNIKAVHHHTCA